MDSRRRGREELLVLRGRDVVGNGSDIGDLDDGLDAGYLAVHGADSVSELGVEHEHLRARVVQYVGDLPGGKSDVDGDEDRTQAHGAVVTLEHLGNVGKHEGDAVALAHADLSERTGKAVDTVVEVGIGVGGVVVYDGGLVGIDRRAAVEECEGVKVLKGYAVGHGTTSLVWVGLSVPMGNWSVNLRGKCGALFHIGPASEDFEDFRDLFRSPQKNVSHQRRRSGGGFRGLRGLSRPFSVASKKR